MWGFWSALLSGALMSIQGVFNTNVTKQTSLWVSTGWVQFSAFLVCVAAWFFTGRESIGMLWQVEDKYNRRSDRCIYHYHSDPEYGKSGACAGGYAYCHFSACGGLSYRIVGDFRCGKSRFSVEKAVGNADLYCRCGYFQMEIEIKVL